MLSPKHQILEFQDFKRSNYQKTKTQFWRLPRDTSIQFKWVKSNIKSICPWRNRTVKALHRLKRRRTSQGERILFPSTPRTSCFPLVSLDWALEQPRNRQACLLARAWSSSKTHLNPIPSQALVRPWALSLSIRPPLTWMRRRQSRLMRLPYQVLRLRSTSKRKTWPRSIAHSVWSTRSCSALSSRRNWSSGSSSCRYWARGAQTPWRSQRNWRDRKSGTL